MLFDPKRNLPCFHSNLYWKKGEDNPWYLTTSLPDQKMTVSAYASRTWIEEMFGYMKRDSFDFEKTMLRHMIDSFA